MTTRYFEDLEVGSRSAIGEYALDADEIMAFARQWDPLPFHVDQIAARESIFGGLTASSVHIFAICTALFHRDPDPIAVLAMLGKDEMRFPNPAREGDRLTYHTECIEKRESKSRPDRGIVLVRDTVTNQDGEPVLTQVVTLMVARRPAPHRR